MFLFERVEAMEYEVVEVKMPKGIWIPDDSELVFLESDEDKLDGDIELGVIRHPGSVASDRIVCSLVQRPKPLKPDWIPPKLKKGWLTWDITGGWWWWSAEPVHTAQYGWVDPSKGDGGDGQEIAEVMAEFFGCPCCDGFDERNCIWEVGE